jgi:hypothetical protein
LKVILNFWKPLQKIFFKNFISLVREWCTFFSVYSRCNATARRCECSVLFLTVTPHHYAVIEHLCKHECTPHPLYRPLFACANAQNANWIFLNTEWDERAHMKQFKLCAYTHSCLNWVTKLQLTWITLALTFFLVQLQKFHFDIPAKNIFPNSLTNCNFIFNFHVS